MNRLNVISPATLLTLVLATGCGGADAHAPDLSVSDGLMGDSTTSGTAPTTNADGVTDTNTGSATDTNAGTGGAGSTSGADTTFDGTSGAVDSTGTSVVSDASGTTTTTATTGGTDTTTSGTTGTTDPTAAGGSGTSSGGTGTMAPIPVDPNCPADAPMDGDACDGFSTSSCSYGTLTCDCPGGGGRRKRMLTWRCTETAMDAGTQPAPDPVVTTTSSDTLWPAAWDALSRDCALSGCHANGAGKFTLYPTDEQASLQSATDKSAEIWNQLSTGTMPPVAAAPLSTADAQAIMDWLNAL